MSNEESNNQVEESLRRMYELGVEHGRELEKRDITIKQLEEQLADIQGRRLIEELEKKHRG